MVYPLFSRTENFEQKINEFFFVGIEITINAKTLLEKENSRINRITSEANCTLTFLTELETKEGWELCKQDEGITTWFKQLPDSPTYYIKIKGPTKLLSIFNIF